MGIREKILRLLEQKNLRQADLARGTGIDRSHLNRLLSGKSRWNQDHYEKIAKYFGIDINQLFENQLMARLPPAPKYKVERVINTDVLRMALESIKELQNQSSLSIPPERQARIQQKLYEHWMLENEMPTLELAKKYFLIS